MNEVSCKVFGLMFGPIAEKGLTLADVVQGSGVSAETLEDKKARIDWAEYVKIMANLRPHFTDEEYIELGRRYLRAPGLRFAFVIGRLAMSPMDFYRWFSKPKQGVGNQMFNCILPAHRELGGGEIELDLTLPEGYEVCWDWFLISRGNLEEMPALLGYPRAEITLSRIPSGGRYRILVPQGTAFFKRVARFLTRPFVRRDAAKELREAHETLLDRYEEIEDARTKLGRQAAQLRVAHSINVLVQRDVDVEATLNTIAKSLVEEAQFAWAQISVEGRSAEAGTPVPEVAPIEALLEGRGGERVGRLVASPQSEGIRHEQEELLAFITPSLAIALQNALYRTDLERKVDERTAELRQASAALAGTVEQLREAQGARERFFGNISHEIRTPLSIVLLAVSDIEKRSHERLDPRARAALGSITDSARKLVRLVDELLLLAAGQEGKLRVHAEPTNLSAMAALLVNAWLPAAEAAGLTLRCNAPAHLFANVDPVAIERVATNLVSNAIKYTPGPGAIEVELAVEPDHLRLSVFDSGEGISDELSSRLFGRFERAESVRRIGGTGIGLALVKQLVEAHGGTVGAYPRAPRGTELRVQLPASVVLREYVPGATVPVVASPPAVATSTAHLAPPDALARGSILLAEDDVQLAEMIGALLGEEYVVRVANDGVTALEIARRHQPQLLITDVDMPGMDGIELSKRFREVTNDRLAPVIILSAVLDLGTRVAGLEAGAIDYVTKPFDPTELLARVRAQFRMRDLAMRLHRAEQLSTLGVLTSGLAHELRNPANGVVNAVEPLRHLLPPELLVPDQPVGQLLDVIGECAEQINTLARQLLGFRNSATELQVRPVKLHELVQRSLSIGPDIFRDVVLRVRVPDDVTVECAPPLVVQVLTNLLENAAHAAGRGGWIEVIARTEDGQVSLEVSDSGPGVPVELRSKVFEPFFTTKKQGMGTGLGLAVSREIVARHRGTLEIEDQGAHSVFVVRLPARASSPLVS